MTDADSSVDGDAFEAGAVTEAGDMLGDLRSQLSRRRHDQRRRSRRSGGGGNAMMQNPTDDGKDVRERLATVDTISQRTKHNRYIYHTVSFNPIS